MIALPIMFALGLFTGYLIWGAASAAQPVADSGGLAQYKRYDISVDDDPYLGKADAPITIVEFSDYQCPFCRKWRAEVFDQLMADYGDQIRFVYRDLPLASIHENAVSAAEAADCANDQDQYWQFHDALFSMQYGLGAEAYSQYAQDLGLNTETFNACVTSRKYQQEVEADFQYAIRLGVSSTPTFFINGIPLIGAQPYENFKQLIDKELAGEIP